MAKRLVLLILLLVHTTLIPFSNAQESEIDPNDPEVKVDPEERDKLFQLQMKGRALDSDSGAASPVSPPDSGKSEGGSESGGSAGAWKGGTVRFSDDWKRIFPTCTQTNNRTLSPIDIDTKKVINYSKTTRTLMIYSYEPIKNYSLTTSYFDPDNGGVTMSACFVVDKGIFFESTYINGCGMDEFLMFDRGAIFFSKTPLRPDQSMHRINGKTYPMEVMLYFKDNSKSNVSTEIKESAQIFILFEITKYDNPLFFPILEAAKKMKSMKPKSIQKPKLEKEIAELEEKIKKMNETYTKGGLTAESLSKKKPIVFAASKLKEATIDVKVIDEQELVDTKADLKVKGFEESLQSYNGAYETAKSNYESMKQKASSGDAVAKNQLSRSKTEAEKLKNIKFYFQRETSILLRTINDLETRVEQFNKQIDEQTKVLEANEVGESFELKNFTMFEQMLKNKTEMKKKMQEQTDKLKAKKKELQELIEFPGRKVKMNTFQVSWLMPEVGGYYAYNGSIPLPPCQRVRYSIVLENPSYLSQSQFDLLASIPKLDDLDGVADQVAPRLQKLNGRKIYYNHKNIQYQRDDGVHMKSIQKRKLKKEKKNGGVRIDSQGIWNLIVMSSVLLMKT